MKRNRMALLALLPLVPAVVGFVSGLAGGPAPGWAVQGGARLRQSREAAFAGSRGCICAR